jgi:hypothetical protein
VVPLLIQILAVAGTTFLLRVILVRLGVELGLPHTAALAVAVFLLPVATINMREQWKVIDEKREADRGLDSYTAMSACTGVGVDSHFLGFVGSRVPQGERFYLESATMKGTGEYCIRFLLLPRTQVLEPEEARYLVFWDPPSTRTLDEARRRGARIHRWDETKSVAVMP